MTDSGGALLGAEAFTIDGTGAPILLASRCTECGGLTFPRAQSCSACGSEALEDSPQPSDGKLYTHTTVHVAAKRWGGPAAFGYIDLPTGLRVFAHLEGQDWQAGEKVTLALVQRGLDGARTFAFRHAGAA